MKVTRDSAPGSVDIFALCDARSRNRLNPQSYCLVHRLLAPVDFIKCQQGLVNLPHRFELIDRAHE